MQTDININSFETRSLHLPLPISSSITDIQDPSTKEIQVTSSVVIVGANGSGKTRLGVWIDGNSPQKSLVHRVGAQKSLEIPQFFSTSSMDVAENMLLYGYHAPNTNFKSNNPENYKVGQRWGSRPTTFLQSDYDKLLTYLFTEEFEKSTRYRQKAIAIEKKEAPPQTRLDIIKNIWEFLLPHRELIIGAGKIEARSKSSETSYHASEMSDGERVIFYLIGQCLAAKENGIIVIDEPEIHLHRGLQSRLWEAIEAERSDCLFVYLTHDLDFAVTRTTATKIWLKSYEDNKWDWRLIPDNEDIPERLLLEILGSRKPILFVEGDRNSLDYFLFSHLFRNFTVTPCGSHEQVIHATCSFFKLKNIHNLECRGIIDLDFRTDEQVQYLKQRNVFCLNVSEIENLFISEDVLRAIAIELHIEKPDAIFDQVKKLVFTQMQKEKERLISAIVAARIEDKFSKFNAKALGVSELENSLSSMVKSIDVSSLYEQTRKLINTILDQQDYSEALRFYNNKGLLPQVSNLFGFKNRELIDFIKRLIKSKNNQIILNAFQKLMPELLELHPVSEVQDSLLSENISG